MRSRAALEGPLFHGAAYCRLHAAPTLLNLEVDRPTWKFIETLRLLDALSSDSLGRTHESLLVCFAGCSGNCSHSRLPAQSAQLPDRRDRTSLLCVGAVARHLKRECDSV